MKKPILLLLAVTFSCGSALCQVSPADARRNGELLQKSLADFDKKNYDAALKNLIELNERNPGDPFVLNLLGAAYTRKKDYVKAKEYFDLSLQKSPDFFPAKFNVGELMFLQRQYAESLEFFSEMLEKDPRNELLQFKIFLSQLQLGNKEEAQKALNRVKYPGDTPAWYYAQAAWESKQGNNKKAIEYLTGAKYIFGPKTALFDETFEDLGIKLR